ncbi:MAG: hypothetical protein KDD69_10395 [Bdellovibrionales bacterium]|nr:hypothetical protein [Bdellovibrionales bacterium]
MLQRDVPPTKILFIEHDEAAFQIRQCIARALLSLPPVELYHARDATEALSMLESLNPDVIVIDGEETEERELFIDSLSLNHPPIVVQTEAQASSVCDSEITCIQKNDSLEGIHQTLTLAAALGEKFTGARVSGALH